MAEKPIDPRIDEALKKCNPQKAIYALADLVDDYQGAIDRAQTTADGAQQTAETAQETADTALTNANAAKTESAAANAAATKAEADAAKAEADAANALTTANSVAADVARSLVDLNAGGDGSTVTLNAPRNTGNPATAPLPVADATKAGVMNSATYVNLQNLNTRVSSLENQTTTYIVSFTNDNPTQDEINNAYKTAYPTAPFPPIDGTTVIDSTRQLYYRWVKNGAIWLKTTGFVISQFTNETAGTIKGSTTAGQIQAETDGTGSLVGYDTLVSNIAQNTTAIGTANGRIGAVETKNTEQDTAITRAQTVANNSYGGFGVSKTPRDVKLNLTKNNGDIDTFPILPVDTQNSGIVTPTMFNAWNNNTTAIGTANGRIDAVETKNTEQDTAITRAQTVANNSYGGFGVSKTPQDVKLNLTKNNGDIDTFPILPVDTQNSGIVTPTMFNAWNNATKPVINQLDISGTNTTTTIYTYNGGTIDLTIDTWGKDMRIDTTGGITLTGQATYAQSSQAKMQTWLKANYLSLDDTNLNYNMDFILYQNNEFKAILKIYLIGISATQTTAVVVSYEY